MAIQSNFPAIKPSLLLDFANTKSLDPRITFTRASTATYYDGVTTSKAEENLFVYSQELEQWSKIRCSVTANTTTAPDGTSTAETLIEDTSSLAKYIRFALTVVSGSYTTSIYAKANTRSWMAIRIYDGSADKYAYFDLSSGALGTVDSGVTATITSVGSGWYRCTHTYTLTAGSNREFQFLISDGNNTANTYTGNGTSSIYLWGAQLEQRSAVTAYTATTTQAITNYIPKLQSAASGVARFDNNPTTGESLGLLIEEQRTNLVTYSSGFDNAAWGKTNATVTADTIVAPDGTLTGDKLVENSATSSHNISQVQAISSGASYTVSVYAKAAERTQIQLQFYDGTTNKFPIFSLVDGTKVTDGGIGTAWTSTNVGNGWWRFTITATSATTTGYVYIYPASGGAVSYTGNGFSGIYIWGVQMEAGAFATSYIPTVASQVTRSADAASMTGTNFSSWYNQAEGSVYTEFAVNAPSVADGFGRVFQFDDGTNNNAIQLLKNNGASSVYYTNVSVGGASVATLFTPAITANTFVKVGTGYKVNDFAQYTNGGTLQTDNAGGIPVVNRLQIGAAAGGSGQPNGTIRKIAYYPLRVTNANLQALTS